MSGFFMFLYTFSYLCVAVYTTFAIGTLFSYTKKYFKPREAYNLDGVWCLFLFLSNSAYLITIFLVGVEAARPIMIISGVIALCWGTETFIPNIVKKK